MSTPTNSFASAFEPGPSTGIHSIDYWDRPSSGGWRTVILSPDGLAHALAAQIGGPGVLRLDPRLELPTLIAAIDHRAEMKGSRPLVAVVDLDVCWPGSRESWANVLRLLVNLARLREIHLVCPYTTHPDAPHLDPDELLSIGSTVWRISIPRGEEMRGVRIARGKVGTLGTTLHLDYDPATGRFCDFAPLGGEAAA